MDKIKWFFKTLWDRLKLRWVGFYLLLPVAVMSFIIPFVYMSGFLNTEYMSAWAVVLPFSAIACMALAFFKPTARYAPVAMFVMELIGLSVFIKTSYMHLTTAFFGGINGNVFVQAGFSFSFCTVVYFLNIVICAVAMCFSQYKGERATFYGNIRTESAELPLADNTPSEEVGK